MNDEPSIDHGARIEALEARVAQLEAELGHTDVVVPAAVGGRIGAPSLDDPPPPPPPPGARPSDAPITVAPATAPRPPRVVREPVSTEVVLKWAGLVLVFLAAAFLVSTAIDRGWIGPELQLAGTLAIGAVLIGAGLWLLERFRNWAVSFVTVGVAVMYVAAVASHEWLDLVGIGVATIGSIIVAAGGWALSRHVDSQLVAAVSYLGAIIAPAAVGAADEYGSGPSSVYVLIAAAAFVALYIERRWALLFLIVGVVSLPVGLAAAFDNGPSGIGQVVIVLMGAVFLAGPILLEQQHGPPADELQRLFARLVLAVPLWVWGATVALHEIDEESAASFAIAMGVAAAVAALAVLIEAHISRWLWASLVLAGFVVVGAGLAALLEGPALLAAFAVQALAMLVLTRVVADPWFLVGSLLLAGVVLIVTAGLTLEAIDTDPSVGADAVHLGVFVATGAIGWLTRDRVEGQVLGLAAYGGLLVWILSALVHIPQGQVVVSAVWAAIGVAVVLVGLSRRRQDVTWVGMGTLALVVGKLLSVDLAEVETFWRAGLFFVIGLGFLWLSARIPRLFAEQDSGE
ncbi:MAG: DUF2339 domain-containing protein [Acidimicrobiales bacterium]